MASNTGYRHSDGLGAAILAAAQESEEPIGLGKLDAQEYSAIRRACLSLPVAVKQVRGIGAVLAHNEDIELIDKESAEAFNKRASYRSLPRDARIALLQALTEQAWYRLLRGNYSPLPHATNPEWVTESPESPLARWFPESDLVTRQENKPAPLAIVDTTDTSADNWRGSFVDYKPRVVVSNVVSMGLAQQAVAIGRLDTGDREPVRRVPRRLLVSAQWQARLALVSAQRALRAHIDTYGIPVTAWGFTRVYEPFLKAQAAYKLTWYAATGKQAPRQQVTYTDRHASVQGPKLRLPV